MLLDAASRAGKPGDSGGRGEGNSGQVVWDLMSIVKPLAFPLGEKGVPGGLCTEGGMTRLLSEKVHLAVE